MWMCGACPPEMLADGVEAVRADGVEAAVVERLAPPACVCVCVCARARACGIRSPAAPRLTHLPSGPRHAEPRHKGLYSQYPLIVLCASPCRLPLCAASLAVHATPRRFPLRARLSAPLPTPCTPLRAAPLSTTVHLQTMPWLAAPRHRSTHIYQQGRADFEAVPAPTSTPIRPPRFLATPPNPPPTHPPTQAPCFLNGRVIYVYIECRN